ncbi:hypothetical protein ES703_69147 [subsurface metagenome]
MVGTAVPVIEAEGIPRCSHKVTDAIVSVCLGWITHRVVRQQTRTWIVNGQAVIFVVPRVGRIPLRGDCLVHGLSLGEGITQNKLIAHRVVIPYHHTYDSGCAAVSPLVTRHTDGLHLLGCNLFSNLGFDPRRRHRPRCGVQRPIVSRDYFCLTDSDQQQAAKDKNQLSNFNTLLSGYTSLLL